MITSMCKLLRREHNDTDNIVIINLFSCNDPEIESFYTTCNGQIFQSNSLYKNTLSSPRL